MEQKITVHAPDISHKKKGISRWRIPESEKRELIRFLEELALGRVNKGRKLADKTVAKYLHVLRVPLEFLNKPSYRITLSNLKDFEKAIGSGGLKSARKKKPYSHSMQVDIRIALRIFLRWRLGAKGVKLTDWFDCRDVQKTPDFLRESEIEALYKHCKSAQERYLIAVLFDSGARAEEFHNIRFEDIHLPEGGIQFVKITLKGEYSKTIGRTLSLYWKHSLEAVRDYFQQRMREGWHPGEPVFNASYDSARFLLARLGQRTLRKHVHYHLFRHSSATFYASRLNRQELCLRYGWRFSSNMPDVYISRAGMDSKDLDKKFAETTIETIQKENNRTIELLQTELAKQKDAEALKDRKVAELERAFDTMQRQFEQVAAALALKPSIEQIETELAKRKREVSFHVV